MRTEFQNIPAPAEASISRRGVSPGAESSGKSFSTSLSAAEMRLEHSNVETGAANRALGSPLQSARTRTAGRTVGDGRNSAPSSSVQTSGRNPFDNPEGRIAVTGEKAAGTPFDEWRSYFLTHAPGQWWFNPVARARFAEIYGDRALVTLDYTGTIPENIDPNFVTNAPLDSAGKPFPRSTLAT